MMVMTRTVLVRAKDGTPLVTEYAETPAERRARIKERADGARRRLNLTPGQLATLRKAAAAGQTAR